MPADVGVNPLWPFIIGVILGWAIEWIIDWVYWRRQMQAATAEEEELRAHSARVQAELAKTNTTIIHQQSELVDLRKAAAAARADVEKYQGELTMAQDANQRYQVDVDGLQAALAGARIDTETCRLELDATRNSLQQYKAEIDMLQAELAAVKADSEQMRVSLDTARNQAGDMTRRYSDPLRKIKGISPAHEQRLYDAGIFTFGGLAAQTPEYIRDILDAQADSDVDPDAWIVEAQQTRLDPLRDIRGIGPMYERRLYDAGIYTFADLAAQSPERLREIVGAEGWQNVDPEAWIAEARLFAEQVDKQPDVNQGGALQTNLSDLRRENEKLRSDLEIAQRELKLLWRSKSDPLIDINGIGPIYEQRLFDAGIYTFEELADQDPQRLREIVGAKEWQDIDAEAWIAEAQQLAGKTKPDPLWDINGIGPVYEKRLLDAGIYTFDALAALSPERIREIVKPKEWQNIDPDAWIAEARELARQLKEGVYQEGKY